MRPNFVLDTGALIALEHDRVMLAELIRAARLDERELRVVAPVVTEFLGGARPARRAMAGYVVSRLRIGDVNEALARRAADLMHGAQHAYARAVPGAIDALVAAYAETMRDLLVYDGDRADFEALAAASGRIDLKELRELS